MSHRLALLPLLPLLAATCATEPPAPYTGPSVTVEMSALTLPGVGDVVWDVEVNNGAGTPQTVWHKRVASSRYGDGAGSASLVGPCDADPAAATNTVRVWVVGVYAAAVSDPGAFASGAASGAGEVTGAPLPFENPTLAGPLERSVVCDPNADAAVRFDVALMRPAQQGFFDTAVSFNNIFCSAKFDCCKDPAGSTCAADGSEDVRLLFDASGQRASTLILGFACTGGTGDTSATELYLDALALDCTSPGTPPFEADLTLNPAGPAGNQCTPGADGMSACVGVVTEADPGVVDADGVLYQLAIYRGLELLEHNGTPAQKVYWNIALGVKRPGITACRLRARATADDSLGTHAVDNGQIGAGVVYPYVQWDVDLATCTAEPLTFGDASAMVRPEYTRTTDPATAFAYGYGAHFSGGPFCVPACQNGGQCASGACACPSGFTGDACESAANACTPANPCQNGGACTVTAGGYSCACLAGYSGTNCEVATSACAPTNPCQNGGACTVTAGGYSCACVGGYSGADCELAPSACAPTNPCQNGGACTVTAGGYSCACVGAFSGTDCELAPSGCTPVNPCQNGGGCVVTAGGYSCECVGGFTGTHCETASTACTPVNPCQNGGLCTPTADGYACDCTDGFGGADCDVPLPCGLTGAPCLTGEFCTAGGVCLPDGTTPNPAPVSLAPAAVTLLPGATAAFTATDGNTPYALALVAGGGDLVGSTYTAPTTPGSATLRVTDAFGATADALVTITAPLALTPSAVGLGESVTFTASGGVPGYTYTLISGGGSLSGPNYTAPATPGLATVRVTDATGHTLDATVTLYAPLALTPTTANVQVNATLTFAATGGVGGHTFGVTSGGGSFTGATYTAPATPGPVTVRVTDGYGHTATATLTLYPALVISPSNPTVEVSKSVAFTTSGGFGAHTLTKPSGTGTLSVATYTAASTVGTGAAVIRVTDALGNTRDANVTIIAALTGVCQPNPCQNGGLCEVDPDDTTVFACECVDGWSGELCDEPPAPCGTSGLPCDPGYFCTDVGVCVPNGTTPNPTPVAISPATVTLMVNAAATFTATSGNPPYTFSVAAGDGALSGATYTAPPWAGTAVVRVTDAFGVTSDATVTVRPPLAITPSAIAIAVNGATTFSASGGIGAYTFTKVAGGGTLSGATYTAPATTGTATIRVTDGVGNLANATVTISAFAITPTTPAVVTGGTVLFGTSGGSAPYTYTVTSGGGTFSGATYTAPSTPGTATVRVTSANGWTAQTTVTIYAPLVISPAAPLVMAGQSRSFAATGGLGAVSFSKPSGEGSLVGALFTASANAGPAVVRATDSLGNTSDAAVTVYATLTLSPAASWVLPGETVAFSAAGGHGAYTYSVAIGGGAFNGAVFNASGGAGTAVVQVTDGLGNTAQATVTVYGYVKVSAGGVTATGGHACGVRSDGTLWCWGYNNYGQVGDGTVVQKTWPTPIGTETNWRDVAAGQFHSCGTRTDGTLWCWGYGGNGRLGTGSTSNQSAPVRVGTGTNWFAVTAGGAHTCALEQTGQLWCWGYNNVGQLGDATLISRTTPVPITAGSATWLAVSTGHLHTCAIASSGALYCWGEGADGRLGRGSVTDSSVPVRESSSATDWNTVAAGFAHTCATRANGTLWCWGLNTNSRLGDGTATARTAPVQIGATLGTWAQAGAGVASSCATQANGTLWCWGLNTYGQVGDGTITARTTPVQVGTSTAWTQIDVGPEHACAARTDGTLNCWGWDNTGQLGIGGSVKKLAPVRVPGSWSSVGASKYYTTCGTKTDGTAWCWGYNAHGEHGNATTTASTRPMLVGGGSTAWAMNGYNDMGRLTNCALRSDATLWCWGYNAYGQIGDASATQRTSPVQTVGGAVWAQVTGGYYHTCGLRLNGTLWCWGYGNYYATGNGSTANKTSPFQVGADTNWSQVSAGVYFSCGVRTDGTLWCWGRNNYYQLGDGTVSTRTTPVRAGAATNWAQVSAGRQYYTCGIQTDGTLWCWGYNGNGQVGDGTTATKTSPTRIGTASNWAYVATGYQHTCAIRADGSLWCWGANTYGQIGDLSTTARKTPVRIGSANTWAKVTCGLYHTCATRTEGSLYCWGRDTEGQIGIGGIIQTSPVPVQ